MDFRGAIEVHNLVFSPHSSDEFVDESFTWNEN